MSAMDNGPKRTLTLYSLDAATSVFSAVERSLRICALNNLSCSLALLDVQDMAAINRKYGYEAGSELLIAYGRALAGLASPAIVLRCGGDEFAVLLPGLDSVRSVAFAKGLQSDLSRTALRTKSGTAACLLSRVGGATQRATETTPQAIIHAADRALASAKHIKIADIRWNSAAFTNSAAG